MKFISVRTLPRPRIRSIYSTGCFKMIEKFILILDKTKFNRRIYQKLAARSNTE